jgi:hypothetical protein
MHDARCLRCYGRLVLLCRVMQESELRIIERNNGPTRRPLCCFLRRPQASVLHVEQCGTPAERTLTNLRLRRQLARAEPCGSRGALALALAPFDHLMPRLSSP